MIRVNLKLSTDICLNNDDLYYLIRNYTRLHDDYDWTTDKCVVVSDLLYLMIKLKLITSKDILNVDL
jgi:hypothetical protein